VTSLAGFFRVRLSGTRAAAAAVVVAAVALAGCSAAATVASRGRAAPKPPRAVLMIVASAGHAAPAGDSGAVAAASAGHLAPAGTSRAASGGPTVPGAPGCPVFPADNVWNTNISRLPVNKYSAAWMRSMDAGPGSSLDLHPDFGPDPGGYPYGIPFTVVTSKTRRVRIAFRYADESYRGLYPFGPRTPIEGGSNASGDRHAIMVNKTTCALYELWEARYSSRGSTAGSGAEWSLTSNALRPAGWTSADAAGLPILPGLLDFAQVQAAVRTGKPITHAIRFTAAVTQDAYLWPARHEASSDTSRNVPPMGARFRLKASFSVARFCRNSQPYCRDAKVVLTEMQGYGLILADNGSNWYFQGSAFPQWPDALVTLLKGIPARDFQAVSESCLMVSRNSGEARARPGCPIG
jgi:hypothetical protein